MTTPSRQDRYASGLTASKILAFLQGGGKAKLGKATSEHTVTFGGDLEKAEGEYVVAVPREGVSQAYWHTTRLALLQEHASITISGTDVSLA